MRKCGSVVAVFLLLAVVAGSSSVLGATGPSIIASKGSGQFQMVGSEFELEALVTRDGNPAPGEKVIFWIVADPSKPDKMKKEATTPATFVVSGRSVPAEGIGKVEVTSDRDGLAIIPFRLGSKGGTYQVQASIDGLVGQPALFSTDAGRLPILIITLLGGLGMFIFGMNLMGDTLQRWAGAKMRSILSFFTRNRVVALISGVIITFVLQSSGACTVLLVGFVNSGLMTLAQTIGVILGADIGTTLTVQLIAFDVGQFALAFVFIGFVCIFFIKNPSLNYLGKILIGFGLLFYGLNVMGGSMKPLAKYPPFIAILQGSTSSPLILLLVSTMFTAVILSSAATIAIAIGLAMQVGPDGKPILSLMAAIPIIYGANVGTTITATLAAIGTTRDAKRVALAHAMFKVVGVLIFMFLIGPLSSAVESIGGSINRQIANAHTILNVSMALCFLPFTRYFGILIMKILPIEPEKEEAFKAKYLASDLTRTPGIALDQTKKEIGRMAEIAIGMSDNSIEVFRRKNPALVDSLKEENRKISILELAIRPYLAEIGAQDISENNSAYALMLLNISNEYREMGNTIAQDILPLTGTFIEKNLFFSPEGWSQLQEFQASVAADVRDATRAFVENDTKLAEEVTQRKPALVRLEKKLTKEHFERLSKGMSESVETSTLHMGLMGGLRRVNSFATNIAYAVLGQV